MFHSFHYFRFLPDGTGGGVYFIGLEINDKALNSEIPYYALKFALMGVVSQSFYLIDLVCGNLRLTGFKDDPGEFYDYFIRDEEIYQSRSINQPPGSTLNQSKKRRASRVTGARRYFI
ncbi:hypothetical protein CBW46_017330 [Paenibacillus xerothermodurans]|uniref:Uncharacterized protein n=1 Tax=Paenibacillus xerothermodurans TaxID=1977292 RepID=A0A2W1N782_PAEXE|nr:hypothetical protein CBW46_017330 [Paenibacillus xerothermodurans]